MTKRLRTFAGPNGSGKSTFIKNFPSALNLKLGVYVNADALEQELKETVLINLNVFQCSFTSTQTQDYFKSSLFSPVKLGLKDMWKLLSVSGTASILISEMEEGRNVHVIKPGKVLTMVY